MARRASLVAAAVVCVALAVFVPAAVAPWASRDGLRPASVPSPPALLELGLVAVPPGRMACTGPFVMDGDHAAASFTVATFANVGPPLRLDVHGRGYRARARIPGGYGDNVTLRAHVAPPRAPLAAEVCIRNVGRRPIALYGANDARSNSRLQSRVEDRPVNSDISLAFYERAPRSLLDRLPRTVERVTAFRPAVVGPWLVWTLIALVLLGVPAAVAWAVAAAERADG